MTMQINNKPNQYRPSTKKSLSSLLPEGMLVNRNALKNKGINRPLVDYYLRSGVLEAVARGIYRRPGPPLKWQHVVYSLQELGFAVHVGGRSALDHQGMAHYLPMGRPETVHLYSENKLPAWLFKVTSNAEFEHHQRSLFSTDPQIVGYTSLPFGAWDWPVTYSMKERALLEYLDDLPDKADLDMADKYMEGATTLRPALVMELLRACKRIKTKRLFLWLAERYQHAWLTRMDVLSLDLGSGKRMVYKGGVLDRRYNITVPREYANGENADGAEQPIF